MANVKRKLAENDYEDKPKRKRIVNIKSEIECNQITVKCEEGRGNQTKKVNIKKECPINPTEKSKRQQLKTSKTSDVNIKHEKRIISNVQIDNAKIETKEKEQLQSSTKTILNKKPKVNVKHEEDNCNYEEIDNTNEKQNTKNNTKVEIKSRKELKITVKNEEPKAKCNNYQHTWLDHVLLSEWQNINENLSKNLINLFDNGNTIPFIARYRKNIIGNMSVEDLKDIRDKYEEINAIKEKAKSVIKILEKQKQLNDFLSKSILNSTSVEEIDYIYAPYKVENKKTLAARAIALGLEDIAVALMDNRNIIDLNTKINADTEGLENLESVEKGVIHIIAHLIATNTEILTFIRNLKLTINFTIETKKSTTKTQSKVKLKKNENVKSVVDESKFENYFEFKTCVTNIKHHQVLAINRGESQKVLSVKVIVPDFVFYKFSNFCRDKWINIGMFNAGRKSLLEKAIQDSYTRLVQPLIIRETRTELKLKAEKASIDVFTQNLKQLLLTEPVKGKFILGIDPGFTNGCKIGLISDSGHLVDYITIYPHGKNQFKKDASTQTLKNMLLKHSCSLIAIGNGTACRETETWISELISRQIFHPLDVNYTIVNENGASIYSCSPEAKKEFPDHDPNIISAVSLARRVQEPLAELVKVEPKHLGVGMYQHDLTKKRLEDALSEVISECVSFVGVDLNTTSQCLLRRVAGLSDKKAADIITYREKNGAFVCREDIMKVNRIGKRIYEQCAGFLRVGPINKDEALKFYKNSKTNKLDCTDIHPESYHIVQQLLKKFKLPNEDIGKETFIAEFKSKMNFDLETLSEELNTEEETLKLIVESLKKPLNYDFRTELSRTPLFKKGLTSINDLKIGTILTGRVQNCTHFGCFVDIGVGSNGLLHTSQFNGLTFQVGDQVEVTVISIDIVKKRISLKAVKKIK